MKKEQILKTSIEILAERGYANTTTRMISEKAGIAVGSIYTHFKSKEAILDEIFLSEYEKRATYLKSLKKIQGRQIDKFDRFLDFHFMELDINRDLMMVLARESGNPELQDLDGVQKFVHQLPDFFKTILDEAKEIGEIRPLNTTLTGKIIFSTIRGTVFDSAIRTKDLDLDDIKKELQAFIKNAIQI